MRSLLAMVCLILLAGPAFAQGRVVEIIPGTGDDRVPVSMAETTRYVETAIPKARDLLDRQLIDYPSARFRGVQASGAPFGLNATFCGLINSRNRAGGFTGWEPFVISISENNEYFSVSDGDVSGSMIELLCVNSNKVSVSGDFSSRLTYR